MSNKPEEFIVEPTPVVDLSKHMLSDGPENFSANDPLESWDNEKTEVYVDSEDDSGNAVLVDDNGDRHPITAFPYILGRGNECDFVLTGKGVSRKHAEIIFQSGRFVVNDLQSLNGIKVNGYKVNRVILEEEDVIKLGEITLTFSSGKQATSASPKKSKKKAEAKVAPQDDTFGKSPAKKAITTVAIVAVGTVLLAGGFYFYQQNQSALEQRAIVADAPAKPQNTTPQPAKQEVAPAAVQQTTSAPPKNTLAPPPSLASAPFGAPVVPKATTPEPVVEKPKVVAKPKPVVNKPAVSSQTTKARSLLNSANNRYLAGEADSLFSEMNRYENNSKVDSKVRSSLKAKHEQLAKLYNSYIKGKEAHVAGNKDLAFEHWGRFMEKEKAFFKNRSRSVYADQVAVKVVEEYVSRGNEAATNGQHQDAYRMWQKALSLGESVAAKIAIETVDAKAKQLYRKALRLEYVNSTKAKELWQDVVNMVPPGSEYHTKASSKLAWYDRWGA